MSSEPIFVLVPGFWHPGKCYQQLIDQVQQRGYDALALDNPSSGLTKPESKTVLDDAQNARSTIVKLIDQGRDVVVITHSYGGAPGGIAAQGLSKKDRQLAGKTGGVVGLVYMAAFPVKEGHFTGGTPAPFVQLNQVRLQICSDQTSHC
ncbi:hypothetical protein K461DRAFT_273197 [Myriangium duriaei CBS 260.36]|uniref:AB hydrolase-1 domain-containing protein n=1 Tax=Myriangium duriaei CBS 260.36 TaxID=1168546 RepID=A0A9P4ML93_9PEZI|nr:hypothetical protein K461DRAFT_273197 [Myriangium duriaei CBS 260.36]